MPDRKATAVANNRLALQAATAALERLTEVLSTPGHPGGSKGRPRGSVPRIEAHGAERCGVTFPGSEKLRAVSQ